MTYETPVGANMFAYCGNNPITREDEGGNVWYVSVAAAVATQYLTDVLGNIISGETGFAVFLPTSSPGDYISAGVTALIPGKGIGSALMKNAVAGGIGIIEASIRGEEVDIVSSMVDVGINTLSDVAFGKASDKADEYFKSLLPNTYSNYAHRARKSNPNLTREEITTGMHRDSAFVDTLSRGVSIGLDLISGLLG